MSEQRVASLDFLRGAAAFLVVIPHFFAFEKIGVELFEAISILGVEIFFVLSGYVLAPQLLLIAKSDNSLGNLRVFLIRRWMRTVPAYLVALIIMSVLMHRLITADFLRYLSYSQNLWTHLNNDYFSIAWSLSVEEWFYVIFPVFLLWYGAVTRKHTLKMAVTSAIWFIVLITAARFLFGDYQSWGPDVRRVVVFRIDSIAYGFLLYVALNKTSCHIGKISALFTTTAFAVIIFFGILLAIHIGDNQSKELEALFPFYAAVLGSACIMMALRANALFASHGWLAQLGFFLGRISYSVYLFHLVVFTAIGGKLSTVPLSFRFAITVGLTVLIAYLMRTAIEEPILAMRPKFRQAVSAVENGN